VVYEKCGGKEYNPNTQGCSNDNKVLTRCGTSVMGYDPALAFCVGNTIYEKCGGREYNPTTQGCKDNAVLTKCGTGTSLYDPSTQFCSSNNTVHAKCSGKEYDPATQVCIDEIVFSLFTDSRDNKNYLAVNIGTQTWMAENLNYTPASGGHKCPNEANSNCTTYGRQYDWATAMALASSYNSTLYTASAKHKGICPTGWHLPSQAEWTTLVSSVGTNPGTKLKAHYGWKNSGNGTDNYGFEALPGGYIEYGTLNDVARGFKELGLWWTTSVYNASNAYNRGMTSDGPNVVKYGTEANDYSMTKRNMLSVRCVKD
jgi:uncharacterized protein (TIGR02145 family)